MLRKIKNGCSVKIGEWATFFATVMAAGADTADTVSASNIEALRVHCRFGKDFRYELQKAEFINKKKLEHE